MLKTLGLIISVAIITINKTTLEDNVAFDTNSNELMPVSGTYLKIGWDQYLYHRYIKTPFFKYIARFRGLILSKTQFI